MRRNASKGARRAFSPVPLSACFYDFVYFFSIYVTHPYRPGRKEKKELMASENPRKRLREEVTCPICLEYFANPVTLPCEHSVCQACISYSPIAPLCPLCKRDFSTQNMMLNYDLAGFVEINKLLNDREEAGRHDICRSHQEPLKLFCRDEEVLICTLCEEEHQGHNIVTVEGAAQEYKV
ncbi:UNVERIFIED_CONTAM: hypothetical protein K2H54_060723 [Gekko kuhli]